RPLRAEGLVLGRVGGVAGGEFAVAGGAGGQLPAGQLPAGVQRELVAREAFLDAPALVAPDAFQVGAQRVQRGGVRRDPGDLGLVVVVAGGQVEAGGRQRQRPGADDVDAAGAGVDRV